MGIGEVTGGQLTVDLPKRLTLSSEIFDLIDDFMVFCVYLWQEGCKVRIFPGAMISQPLGHPFSFSASLHGDRRVTACPYHKRLMDYYFIRPKRVRSQELNAEQRRLSVRKRGSWIQIASDRGKRPGAGYSGGARR
jgi:hypothetical protein